VVGDLAAPALINASREADLLVIGARGLGDASGLLLGSASQQCLDHARCPIAIVRDDMVKSRATARIVVGIDGSATSARALEWAVEAGRLHRSSIEAVHAWETSSIGLEAFGAIVFDPTPPIDAARAMMDAVLGAIYTGHPRAPVSDESIGSVAKAILRASEGADLIVVGSRGLDGVKGRLLGSVTLQVVRDARCPVVVVPPESRATHRTRRRRKRAKTLA
jgi:nucleotide-binding universal stress UspA family protein